MVQRVRIHIVISRFSMSSFFNFAIQQMRHYLSVVTITCSGSHVLSQSQF